MPLEGAQPTHNDTQHGIQSHYYDHTRSRHNPGPNGELTKLAVARATAISQLDLALMFSISFL
jgi:hypothetical protein